jgi:hypothetical protein
MSTSGESRHCIWMNFSIMSMVAPSPSRANNQDFCDVSYNPEAWCGSRLGRNLPRALNTKIPPLQIRYRRETTYFETPTITSQQHCSVQGTDPAAQTAEVVEMVLSRHHHQASDFPTSSMFESGRSLVAAEQVHLSGTKEWLNIARGDLPDPSTTSKESTDQAPRRTAP